MGDHIPSAASPSCIKSAAHLQTSALDFQSSRVDSLLGHVGFGHREASYAFNLPYLYVPVGHYRYLLGVLQT